MIRDTGARSSYDELLAWLNGRFEYWCHVDGPERFDSGEVGRGGVMRVRARLDWLGLVVTIDAERLWSERDGGNVALLSPVPWRGEGGVAVSEGVLQFAYTAGDHTGGWTTDSFRLVEDGFRFEDGTFEHEGSDGNRIKGTVKLRKMSHRGDLLWAPDEVSPETLSRA